MQKKHYDVQIQAPPEKVWDAVVGEQEFREWTKPFSPTSRFEGGWSKGEKIRFLATNEKGETEGMIAEIAESEKPSYLSIRHMGYVQHGVEDTTSEAVKAWAPAYENYTLTRTADGTKFEVDVDVEEKYASMFEEMWPKALAALKYVAER
jgi:uncharacterized protein YndB with AHSA1/START domain